MASRVPLRFASFALPLLLVGSSTERPHATLPPDPAADLVRVRAFLTTASQAVDLGIEGAEFANVTSPDPNLRVVNDTHTAHLTRRTSGEIEVQLDLILANVPPASTVIWTATSNASSVDIYNVNGAAPRHIDRFEPAAGAVRWTTPSDPLRQDGPLPDVGRVPHHLVLAFFYPWWTLGTWSQDPRIADRPVPEYSTENVADLTRIMTTAASARIDAFAVSWSGKDVNGGIDDVRMRRCLTAAASTPLKIAALLETTIANPQHVDGDADPTTVFNMLLDITGNYAPDPAYLRVDGRPVVMAYAAQRLTQSGWFDVLSRLRAVGRDVMLIGEGSNNTRLGAFDGQFYYPSNDRSGDELKSFVRSQGLSVRTYHLLPEDRIGRRVWVGTVSPGYDDTRIRDGRTPRVTDRESGRYYNAQWLLNFDNRADWIVVTSWNEYLENTEIEKTLLYGDLYLRLTKMSSALFRQLTSFAVPRPR